MLLFASVNLLINNITNKSWPTSVTANWPIRIIHMEYHIVLLSHIHRACFDINYFGTRKHRERMVRHKASCNWSEDFRMYFPHTAHRNRLKHSFQDTSVFFEHLWKTIWWLVSSANLMKLWKPPITYWLVEGLSQLPTSHSLKSCWSDRLFENDWTLKSLLFIFIRVDFFE